MLKKLFVTLVALSLPYQVSYADALQPSAAENQVQQRPELFVNINTASAEEIATMLKGIGLKKAQAIVDYRDAHGLFQLPEDLIHVKGIGSSLLEQNHDRIHIQ